MLQNWLVVSRCVGNRLEGRSLCSLARDIVQSKLLVQVQSRGLSRLIFSLIHRGVCHADCEALFITRSVVLPRGALNNSVGHKKVRVKFSGVDVTVGENKF